MHIERVLNILQIDSAGSHMPGVPLGFHSEGKVVGPAKLLR
jgi:hypothetical protein